MTDSGDGIHSRIGFGSKLWYLSCGRYKMQRERRWKEDCEVDSQEAHKPYRTALYSRA